jgi:hypothetical protein
MFGAYSAQELDQMVMHIAPSGVFDMTHFEGWPDAPLYHGHAGFRQFAVDWLSQFDQYEAGIDESIEVSPGCVLINAWQRAYGRGSQVPVEMQFALVFTVSDGVISRLEGWSDRREARADALRR